MFGFKKLRKRIKSLEEKLGFNYVQAEEKDDYNEHIIEGDADYSNISSRVKRIENILKSNKIINKEQ